MSFPEQLRQCRKQKHMSQAELASLLGVTQQAVGKSLGERKVLPGPHHRGKAGGDPGHDRGLSVGSVRPHRGGPDRRALLRQLCYAYSLIPVIGTVKAGYGALAYEEDYGKEYARVKDPSSYFYLVVRGDSMEPRIHDGDLALVHRQDTLENGDLGVLIYGDEGEGPSRADFPEMQQTFWCCSPSNRPIRGNGHQGRGLNHLGNTLQAVWWRPRRSGKTTHQRLKKKSHPVWLSFLYPFFGGAPWNRA